MRSYNGRSGNDVDASIAATRCGLTAACAQRPDLFRASGAAYVRERLLASGSELLSACAAEFWRFAREETSRWSKAVKQAGIVPE